MTTIYKYHFNRRTIYLTLFYLGLFALLGGLLYHLYEGGYLSAWFTSFVVALIALMSLSIPRRIVVTEETVEIRCLLDITEIRRNEIASVRRVEPRRMKWFVPIFGGFGFFGYYGHFIDLRRFDRVRIYASEWKNFVEITDIYEDRLYVSCTDADKLVAQLTPPGGNRPDDENDETIDDEAAGQPRARRDDLPATTAESVGKGDAGAETAGTPAAREQHPGPESAAIVGA